MGIVNGPAPEGGASSVGQSLSHEQQFRYWAEQRDSLKVRLEESERLRQEALAACETLRQQVAELQAQLEAAAVTPAQQPDGAAGRLETVRRLIGEICGWYECTEYLQEINQAEAWEQAGTLLGRLQMEAWRCE